jgi:hypothetical protein
MDMSLDVLSAKPQRIWRDESLERMDRSAGRAELPSAHASSASSRRRVANAICTIRALNATKNPMPSTE